MCDFTLFYVRVYHCVGHLFATLNNLITIYSLNYGYHYIISPTKICLKINGFLAMCGSNGSDDVDDGVT